MPPRGPSTTLVLLNASRAYNKIDEGFKELMGVALPRGEYGRMLDVFLDITRQKRRVLPILHMHDQRMRQYHDERRRCQYRKYNYFKARKATLGPRAGPIKYKLKKTAVPQLPCPMAPMALAVVQAPVTPPPTHPSPRTPLGPPPPPLALAPSAWAAADGTPASVVGTERVPPEELESEVERLALTDKILEITWDECLRRRDSPGASSFTSTATPPSSSSRSPIWSA